MLSSDVVVSRGQLVARCLESGCIEALILQFAQRAFAENAQTFVAMLQVSCTKVRRSWTTSFASVAEVKAYSAMPATMVLVVDNHKSALHRDSQLTIDTLVLCSISTKDQ